MKDSGEKILTPLVSLDTPGKATVEVVILADPVSLACQSIPNFSQARLCTVNSLGTTSIVCLAYHTKHVVVVVIQIFTQADFLKVVVIVAVPSWLLALFKKELFPVPSVEIAELFNYNFICSTYSLNPQK